MKKDIQNLLDIYREMHGNVCRDLANKPFIGNCDDRFTKKHLLEHMMESLIAILKTQTITEEIESIQKLIEEKELELKNLKAE